MPADSALPYDPARDGEPIAALWRQVFGQPKGGQTPQWLFRDSPAGTAPRVVVLRDGRAVAHAGAMPVRLQCGDSVVRAGWSVGAMTDPQCRGQGLFAKAGEALYAHMAAQGFGLVGGFSNAQSAKLHTQTLGRTPVQPFPWCARPLLPKRAGLRPLAEAWPQQAKVQISAVRPGDALFDEIWRDRPPTQGVIAVRDAAWTAWRYGEREDAGYRLAVAHADGRPQAWVAVRALTVARVPALFVVDWQCRRGGEQAAKKLLQSAHALGAAAGCVLASALLPGWGPLRPLLLRAGYVPIPEALHPQKILLSVKTLDASLPSMNWGDPRQWWLAWSDTDVI